MTSSMPTSAAIAWAAAALSPVSSTGRSPSPRSSAIACALVGFTVSATTSRPRTAPSQPTAVTVRPAVSATSAGGMPAWRPAATTTPRPTRTPGRRRRRDRSTTPCDAETLGGGEGFDRREGTDPLPGTDGDGRRDRVLRGILERAGQPEQLRSDRFRAAGTTSTSRIRPVVTVPVLSSTMVSTRRVDSRTCGPLIRMPSWAPRPVPTSRAVGVASPSAHGQAMISTATAAAKAVSAPAPVTSQNPRVTSARPMTIGTNTADTRSASRCTGALPVCACSTSRAIWASWVSAPTLVARTSSRPPAFTVAPTTRSPGPTSTGTGSPVSRLASIADDPSTTSPSVAIFSPGRTTNRSPTTS